MILAIIGLIGLFIYVIYEGIVIIIDCISMGDYSEVIPIVLILLVFIGLVVMLFTIQDGTAALNLRLF